MPALATFLRDELTRRGWSVEDLCRRADLSLSNGYLIIRDGKDNVRRETFESIAAALSMTPAELYVAIGKGSVDDSPRRAPLHALIRLVPDHDLDIVDKVVRPFVSPVPPIARPSIGRRRRASMRPEGEVRERDRTERDTGENAPNAGLDGSYAGLKALLPAVFGRITTRYCLAAGIDGNRPPHAFRRATFTERYRADPANVNVLAARMGWSHMVNVYTRGAELELASEVALPSMASLWHAQEQANDRPRPNGLGRNRGTAADPRPRTNVSAFTIDKRGANR